MLNQYEIKTMQNFTIETLTQSIDNNEKFSYQNTNFEGFNILTFRHIDSDELFFIGKQCAEMLGYTNTTQAICKCSVENRIQLQHLHCMKLLKLISNNINELDDSSRNNINHLESSGLKENRDTNVNSLNSKENGEIYNFSPNGAIFISEQGLYSLIMSSGKKEALQFQNKVYDILKEIRQTGGYNLDKVPAVNYAESKLLSGNITALNNIASILNTTFEDKIIERVKTAVFKRYIGTFESIQRYPVIQKKTFKPVRVWNNHTSVWEAIADLTTYLKSVISQYTGLNKRIADTDDNVAKLQVAVSELDADVALLTNTVSGLVNVNFKSLEEKLDKLSRQVNIKV